jgi:quercetin dioxygenase-like cupin family protein
MGIAGGEVIDVADLVAYQPGSVVSRQLVKNASGSVTVFAFDQGEGLSEHTTPHDALVWITDGEARITVGGETHTVRAGQAILLPGGEPHAVAAPQRFTMSLTMLFSRPDSTP